MEKDFIDPSIYPLARKDESVIDTYHGTKVCDPYRWLEDPDSNETRSYVKELNKVSMPFLKAASYRNQIKEKLTDMWNYERYGCISKHGQFYYYFYNTGLQNQSVMYKQSDLNGKPEIFLDPNKFSEDGITSIRCYRFSNDGSILAYGLSEKGSDWMTLKFRKSNGEDLPDVVNGVKHSAIAWAGNDGVFYSKYPEHKGALEGSSTEKHKYHSLFYHPLNSKEDVLVADFRWDPELMCSGEVSEDGTYLIVDVSKGCDPTNSLYYFDIKKLGHHFEGKLPLNVLFSEDDAKYEFIDNDNDTALILTNSNAPMFKLIRVKMDSHSENKNLWETVIPENEKYKLDWVARVNKKYLVAAYIEDVKNTLYLHCATTGIRICQLLLGIGSVSGFFGRKLIPEIFISFESFFNPGIIYYLDLDKVDSFENIKLRELRKVVVKGVNVEDFCAEQVFYASRDGTKVPMYLLHKKGIIKNQQNATILNGYGGFNIAELPYFSVSRLLFLQYFDGLIACANLRGGSVVESFSEYGEKWHESGMRNKKQNVFDDFIGAAEYLISNKYTSPNKLAIHGGSNGGLLVAVCSQQRPDLFKAVVNRVGVLDMLRFHKFTVGGAWIPEYGNPDEPCDFPFIYKYSPLHNLKYPDSGQWPATLLMTADHDDRVVPSHSLKYIARLYELVKGVKNEQKNPLLIRIDVKAGHGSGKPTSKVIEEVTDMYSFLERVLDLKWKSC
uniref:Prolyl endopeptidase n=1 Tax=Syphacia muris TaxID=451379 RepID=A0A0N5AKL7_9BILA